MDMHGFHTPARKDRYLLSPPTQEFGMSDGGKGSKPRPFSISQQEYDNRWDAIFSRDLKEDKDNTGTSKDEFYDVLSTEDALTEKDGPGTA